MTTTTVAGHAPATPLQRILNVVRLHFTNPWTTIVLPWMILGIIFVASLAVWWIIFANLPSDADRADAADGLQYSGGINYIFVYMMVVAIQAISITFPFAQGYGVTRRDYYLGSSLAFVLLAAMYSIGLTILSLIEELTHGWGFGGQMFTPVYFGDNWMQRLFVFFVTFLFFFFVGAAIATVWVRWKATGVTAFFIVLGVILIGAAALLTFTSSWAVIGNFFAGAGLLGSFAWSLVLTAIAAITGFFVLRRATPRAA
ncbi:MAG: ABC transporter permease [Rhodoglobus sp.]